MIRETRLPPIFHLHLIDADGDVTDEATKFADQGGDPATIICAEREDVLDCAIILHPESDLTNAMLVIYVAALGLGDALGTVVPAGIDMTFRWPQIIDANLGSVARLGILVSDGASDMGVPHWIAVRATIQIGGLEGDWREGTFPETSLFGEGCVEVTCSQLLENFARHFLTWINRWQDDGFDPVRAMWLRHARSHGADITVETDAGPVQGIFLAIGDDGALEFDDGRRLSLRDGLGIPP
jgi:BirA family transcriptional regulator, biotin operon repressor / biotin---[acetyl-CoA-carboxylase] ligase